MPIYEYACEACGSFTDLRPLAECALPQPCPGCGGASPRAMLSAPHFSGLGSARNRAQAVNERSAHEPRAGHRHGPGCGCGVAKPAAQAEKTFPTKRPWMISH